MPKIEHKNVKFHPRKNTNVLKKYQQLRAENKLLRTSYIALLRYCSSLGFFSTNSGTAEQLKNTTIDEDFITLKSLLKKNKHSSNCQSNTNIKKTVYKKSKYVQKPLISTSKDPLLNETSQQFKDSDLDESLANDFQIRSLETINPCSLFVSDDEKFNGESEQNQFIENYHYNISNSL